MPVYPGVAQDGKRQAAVGLLQADSGAYLFGLTEHVPGPGDGDSTVYTVGGTIKAGQEPGEVMTAMRVKHETENHYVVLAPEDTAKVRVGGVTVDVQDRVAFLSVPSSEDTGKAQQAEALDAANKVIAETSPLQEKS